jgi:hypothetical protein
MMAVCFGFSVGDIIAGIGMIKDAVKAIDDSQGASKDYRTLMKELDGLKEALDAIGSLKIDPDRYVTVKKPIEDAVAGCKACIDDILRSIAKYQPHLMGSKSKQWRSILRKVQWALCTREDVQNFRSRLEQHSSIVSLLVTALQMFVPSPGNTRNTIEINSLQERVSDN